MTRTLLAHPLTPPGRRTLAAASVVDSLGDGLWLAGSALFFTRGLGLGVTETGVGLSIAGVVGLCLGAQAGTLADRFSPRSVFVILMLVQAAAVASYVLVDSLPTLVAAASVAALSRQGAQAARGAVIATMAGPQAAALRGYLHAVINVGIAAGAALTGLVIAANTRGAYLALMLTDAATFAVAAGIALRLPRLAPLPRVPGAARRRALADRRFVGLTALSGVLSLQFVISGYLLPLWVVFHTAAPRWLASPLLLLNTGCVVAGQVRVSNRFPDVASGARALRYAGFGLAAACVAFAAAGGPRTAGPAVLLLVVAMVLASGAELFSAAGGFSVSFGLAPAGAAGEYQGVWNLGFGASVALGPAVLTFLCLDGGTTGWLVLGLMLAVTGLAMDRSAAGAPLPVAVPAPDGAARDLGPTPTAAAAPSGAA